MFIRVNATDVRPHLTELLGQVEHAGKRVIIARHGKPVGVLVSMADFNRIWEHENEELYGPKHPATGRPMGATWVRATGWKPGMTVRWNEHGAELAGDDSGGNDTGGDDAPAGDGQAADAREGTVAIATAAGSQPQTGRRRRFWQRLRARD